MLLAFDFTQRSEPVEPEPSSTGVGKSNVFSVLFSAIYSTIKN
jgi:hypothetical protein